MERLPEAKVMKIGDMIKAAVRGWKLMLLLALALFAVLFFALNYLLEPTYRSTAVIYITGEDGVDGVNELSQSLLLVKDCEYILKSELVLNEVIGELELDEDAEELAKRIKLENPEDTRLIELSADADAPQTAQNIANAVCRIGIEISTENFGSEQMRIYQYGNYEQEPCNRPGIAEWILGGFLCFALSFVAVLCRAYRDDRLYGGDEIERYLGVTSLGSVVLPKSGREEL